MGSHYPSCEAEGLAPVRGRTAASFIIEINLLSSSEARVYIYNARRECFRILIDISEAPFVNIAEYAKRRVKGYYELEH